MTLPRLGVLGTRVARRVLLLFTLGAAAPVGVMALLSYAAISSQLRQQSESQLRDLTSVATQSILERLSGFVAIVNGVAPLARQAWVSGSGGQAAAAVPLPPGVTGLLIDVGGERRSVAGSVGTVPPVSAEDLARLAHGDAIVRMRRSEGDGGASVLMATALPVESGGAGTLWARIVGDSVWAPVVTRAADTSIEDMCLLDSGAVPLFCLSGPDSQLPGRMARVIRRSASSGQIELASDEGSDLAFWRDIYLRASFNAPPLTVVVSQPTASVYGAGDQFVYNLLLTLLIGLAGALLLTHILVRRTMEPLEALTVGTRKLAGRDLSARVEVRSDDEFGDLATSFNSMAEGLDVQFRHLEARRAIDHAALTAVELSDAIRTLLEALGGLVPGRCRALLLFESDPEGAADLFVLREPSRSVEHLVRLRARDDPGLERIGQARSHVVDRAEDLPATFRAILRGGDGLPVLILPLRARGTTIGALAVASTGAGAFPVDRVRHGQELADQAAVALEKLRLDGELTSMSWEVLRAFANAIDAKSAWTTGHSERVTELSLAMGRELGLGTLELDTLHRGGLLHDIGKIGVPAEILDFNGKLDEEMRRIMEMHPSAGAHILEPIRAFKPILPIVLYHHERWNGSGYPEGLVGKAIPKLARLVAVADVFDAMVSARPYRPALDPEIVFDHIVGNSGSDFDPAMVAVLESVRASGWRPQDSTPVGHSGAMSR